MYPAIATLVLDEAACMTPIHTSATVTAAVSSRAGMWRNTPLAAKPAWSGWRSSDLGRNLHPDAEHVFGSASMLADSRELCPVVLALAPTRSHDAHK
mmetsp:Transcript_120883/g.353187  ORF Transcript_120883/g.353187 Transcript_120883/m.353187 type:complete len:97 (-) Transcript_120883:197-487(-)